VGKNKPYRIGPRKEGKKCTLGDGEKRGRGLIRVGFNLSWGICVAALAEGGDRKGGIGCHSRNKDYKNTKAEDEGVARHQPKSKYGTSFDLWGRNFFCGLVPWERRGKGGCG